jgi:biopolymer transport protein ExbD
MYDIQTPFIHSKWVSDGFLLFNEYIFIVPHDLDNGKIDMIIKGSEILSESNFQKSMKADSHHRHFFFDCLRFLFHVDEKVSARYFLTLMNDMSLMANNNFAIAVRIDEGSPTKRDYVLLLLSYENHYQQPSQKIELKVLDRSRIQINNIEVSQNEMLDQLINSIDNNQYNEFVIHLDNGMNIGELAQIYIACLDAIVETKGHAIELQFGASLSKIRHSPWRFRDRASEFPFSIRFND